MRRLPEPADAKSNRQLDNMPPAAPAPDASQPRTRESADVHAAIMLLQEHVAAEEEGTASVYLSEVVLRPVTGQPLDARAADLMGALAALHLDRLNDAAGEEDASRRTAGTDGRHTA